MDQKTTIGHNIKCHFKKHKAKYVTGGVCAFTGIVVGSLYGDKIRNRLNNINLTIGRDNSIVNVIDNSIKYVNVKKGHPGNKIMCNETKQLFDSQSEASEMLNLSPTQLSHHMNGKTPHVKGLTFTRMVPEDSQG